MTDTIEILKKEIASIDSQIRALKTVLAEKQEQMYSLVLGVKVGDIVEYGETHYKITRLERYWPIGVKVLSADKIGTREYRMYNYKRS